MLSKVIRRNIDADTHLLPQTLSPGVAASPHFLAAFPSKQPLSHSGSHERRSKRNGSLYVVFTSRKPHVNLSSLLSHCQPPPRRLVCRQRPAEPFLKGPARQRSPSDCEEKSKSTSAPKHQSRTVNVRKSSVPCVSEGAKKIPSSGGLQTLLI